MRGPVVRGLLAVGLLGGGCSLAATALLERLDAPVTLPALPAIPTAVDPPPRPTRPIAFRPPPAPEELADLIGRPPFSATRRPVAKLVAPVEPPSLPEESPAPTVDFTVHGIILLPERRSVLLSLDSEERRVWMQEGEEVQGWVIEEVSATGIRVTQGEYRQEVPLGTERGVSGTARAILTPTPPQPRSLGKRPTKR